VERSNERLAWPLKIKFLHSNLGDNFSAFAGYLLLMSVGFVFVAFRIRLVIVAIDT
jgi:hypothetical protein